MSAPALAGRKRRQVVSGRREGEVAGRFGPAGERSSAFAPRFSYVRGFKGHGMSRVFSAMTGTGSTRPTAAVAEPREDEESFVIEAEEAPFVEIGGPGGAVFSPSPSQLAVKPVAVQDVKAKVELARVSANRRPNTRLTAPITPFAWKPHPPPRHTSRFASTTRSRARPGAPRTAPTPALSRSTSRTTR